MNDDLYDSGQAAEAYDQQQKMRDLLPFPAVAKDKWEAQEAIYEETGKRAVSWTETFRVEGSQHKKYEGQDIFELRLTAIGTDEIQGRTCRVSAFVDPSKAVTAAGKIDTETFDGRRLSLLGKLCKGLGFEGSIIEAFEGVPGLAGKVFTGGYKVRQYRDEGGKESTRAELTWVKVE